MAESLSSWSYPGATTGSTRWCLIETMPTIAIVRKSDYVRLAFVRSTNTLDSIPVWPVSNAYIRRASLRSFTAAGMRTRHFRTLRRWPTGTPPRPTVETNTDWSAGMPTRLYYVSYRNNAFDTHVFQGDLHQRLLTYTADAVSAFMTDVERIGRSNDVVVMMFSEFGRRVPENSNLGTDHGAANLMFVAGKNVKGGHYGKIPSLTQLDEGDNLVYTTDFRRVYATMISGWLGFKGTGAVLNGEFEAFDMFA